MKNGITNDRNDTNGKWFRQTNHSVHRYANNSSTVGCWLMRLKYATFNFVVVAISWLRIFCFCCVFCKIYSVYMCQYHFDVHEIVWIHYDILSWAWVSVTLVHNPAPFTVQLCVERCACFYMFLYCFWLKKRLSTLSASSSLVIILLYIFVAVSSSFCGFPLALLFKKIL